MYQDAQQRILQWSPKNPSSVTDVIVDLDRSPSKNGIVLIGWNQNVEGSQKLEVCFRSVHGFACESGRGGGLSYIELMECNHLVKDVLD